MKAAADYLNTLGIGQFVYSDGDDLIVWDSSPNMIIQAKNLIGEYTPPKILGCINSADTRFWTHDRFTSRCVIWKNRRTNVWHLTFPACVPPVWVTTFGDGRIKMALLYLGSGRDE